MKKVIKGLVFSLCLMLINIGCVVARTELEIETSCAKGNKCVISNDTFSFEIKSVDLYDNQNKKLETISDFKIAPKLYKFDKSDLQIDETEEVNFNMQALVLNMTIPSIKTIVKKYQKTVFVGYIVISYETDFKMDEYSYAYKINTFDISTKPKNDTLPSTGQYKQIFVTLDKDDNLFFDDYYSHTQEMITGQGNMNLIYSLSSKKIDTTHSMNIFDENNFIFIIANDIEESATPTIEDDEGDFATYYEREHRIDTDSDVVDTQEYPDNNQETPEEKSGEALPPTSVQDIAIVVILALLSVILLIFANKKILKNKI